MKLFNAEIMYLVIAVGVFLTVALVLAIDFLWPDPSGTRTDVPADESIQEDARADHDVVTVR